jgi:hypothetical protein
MEDLLYTLLGLAIMYTVVHFYVIQFGKTWSERTVYEKFLTIVGGIGIVLVTFS